MTKPYWPRMMKLKTAAQYCDLTPADFTREVASGRLPRPVWLGGDDHWDLVILDHDLSRLSGDVSDWRKDQPGLNAASPSVRPARKGNSAVRSVFSPAQIAERWGVGSHTVYSWLRAGDLRHFRIGKLYRVREDVLIEFETERGVVPKA